MIEDGGNRETIEASLHAWGAYLDACPHLARFPRRISPLSADEHESEGAFLRPSLAHASLIKCANSSHDIAVRELRVLLLVHPNRASAERPDARVVRREAACEVWRIGEEVAVENDLGLRGGICR